MKTLEDIINKKLDIMIYHHIKRYDGDWHMKVCWKVKWGDTELESRWIGFDTAEEAINDLINVVNKKQGE